MSVIIKKTKNGFPYYAADILECYRDKIRHAVTTRIGGKSQGLYSSLNISFKKKENENNFDVSNENLEIACKELGFTKENAVCVFEDHTDKVAIIDENNKDEFLFTNHHNHIYDAMITNLKNVPLIITIADCNSIVMYDTKNNVVTNIHSGWKGTVQKIYLNALGIMKEKFGTNSEDVICVFSPAIQKCCWKTKDEELTNSFQKYWPNIPLNEFEYKDQESWIHVDFPYCIERDLLASGIKKQNIHNKGICTACNNDLFYSFRRTTERQEKVYGVMASIVELI